MSAQAYLNMLPLVVDTTGGRSGDFSLGNATSFAVAMSF
jgi:hypothetical protein